MFKFKGGAMDTLNADRNTKSSQNTVQCYLTEILYQKSVFISYTKYTVLCVQLLGRL